MGQSLSKSISVWCAEFLAVRFSDHLWAAAGANIFSGGEQWSMFGQFDRDDNVYLHVRYEF